MSTQVPTESLRRSSDSSTDGDTLRVAVLIAVWILLALAALVAFLCLPGRSLHIYVDTLGGGAVAVIVGSLASLSALTVERSWREQRRAERQTELRRKRAEDYGGLIGEVVAQFQGKTPEQLSHLRATVALWGSHEFLARFDEWNQFVRSLPDDGSGNRSLDVVDRRRAHQIVGRLAEEARIDLGLVEPIDSQRLAAFFFDDYEESYEPEGLAEGSVHAAHDEGNRGAK